MGESAQVLAQPFLYVPRQRLAVELGDDDDGQAPLRRGHQLLQVGHVLHVDKEVAREHALAGNANRPAHAEPDDLAHETRRPERDVGRDDAAVCGDAYPAAKGGSLGVSQHVDVGLEFPAVDRFENCEGVAALAVDLVGRSFERGRCATAADEDGIVILPVELPAAPLVEDAVHRLRNAVIP